MNFADLQKLMADFNASPMKELEVDLDGAHVHLSKNDAPFVSAMPAVSPQMTPAAPVQAPPAASQPVAPAAEKTSTEANSADDGAKIESPMVGTIYLQSKPGQPPYVKVGDHVKAGDVVCVIEAMKMMTEVKSKISGTITKVLVENEDLVEFGQGLFAVAED